MGGKNGLDDVDEMILGAPPPYFLGLLVRTRFPSAETDDIFYWLKREEVRELASACNRRWALVL